MKVIHFGYARWLGCPASKKCHHQDQQHHGKHDVVGEKPVAPGDLTGAEKNLERQRNQAKESPEQPAKYSKNRPKQSTDNPAKNPDEHATQG